MRPILATLKRFPGEIEEFAKKAAGYHLPEVREYLVKQVEGREFTERLASLLLMTTQCENALKGDRTFSVIELNATTDDGLPFVKKGWQPPAAIGIVLATQKRNGSGFGTGVTHLDLEAMSYGGGHIVAKDIPIEDLSAIDLVEMSVDLIEKARLSARPDSQVDGAFFASASAAMAMALSKHVAQNEAA